ncbi:hypothetical protein BDM02DRAFT_3090819 [Thelephora ganbajun]|uniref:Uncharacterized protein n=1 Tax=Thelephora ganbajun TaxID=370292 RepID=A0ACB6ZQU4_THEGA|nr:hypothetical protein BDM02DRAFT_3090819 [Thelephora ganbajun]
MPSPSPGANISSSSGNGAPKLLNDYQLGDCLGKGAFGQVYRALNWATGETVAVKEITLANIPKGEISQIMSEIDLLKNLNHPNIVKYKGFFKTREFLYIILEFCENGSLHAICKRFGKFPENLVAVYICQVLEGLVYLHDQGVIHRDIKGANILTNKDGCVKLADFGVAANTTTAARDDAVVGSPYWMAPEVIEQSGATTASDIWSVGCVVIELLEGKPPYHFLNPMPALFRIVQDDCPPIPEGASPIVKDFLYHCFQKDANLRISAKKLLRHPWMVQARKQLEAQQGTPSTTDGRRPRSNYNFDDAVLKVQEWNEALRSPSRPSKHPVRTRPGSHYRPPSPHSPTESVFPTGSINALPSSTSGGSQPTLSMLNAWKAGTLSNPNTKPLISTQIREPMPLHLVLQPPEEQTDNWDDDFEEGISLTKLQALDKSVTEEEKQEADDNARTIRPARSPSGLGVTVPLAKSPSSDIGPIVEDYSDLAVDEDDEQLLGKVADFRNKNPSRRGLFHPDDIKTIGITHLSPGPMTAPLPDVERQSLSPLVQPIQLPSVLKSARSHSRSSSSVDSYGRSEARRVSSKSAEFNKYAETEDEDYDDVFFAKPSGSSESAPPLQLTTRLSSKSWLGDEHSDEEDPFAEIDEGFAEDDLEANLQRDKHARLCNSVNQLIDELTPAAPDFQLQEACNQLLVILTDAPEMLSQLVSSHGMLAILEVLEGNCSREVNMKLLHIVNLLVTEDAGFLESFCLIGYVSIWFSGFASKKYPSECRLEASNFIRLLCNTSVLTLQMFISCQGLKVLVDLLDEDYAEQSELVVDALNGIGSVFELQSPTTKNDFCRMFIREGLLDPLTSALLNMMATRGEVADQMKKKIVQIVLVFSQVTQSDIHVRNALGTRKIVRRLLRACELLEPQYLVNMLKAVKHLSMNATLLEVLQNANALEILIRLLDEQSSGSYSAEVSNHIFQTCYNLCRLNKSRQEEAAQAGIIPSLKRVIESKSPLKQFALPILCDLASAGKSCRKLLWQHDGLRMYVKLLSDPYFQVSALEAIHSWLQDETARVEDQLLKPETLEALLKCFVSAKANSFEGLLDPFLKICRLSTNIAIGIAKSQFFKRVVDRLGHSKALVRLNLLRIVKAVCDIHPNRAILVERYGIYEIVAKLSKEDGAVLVRELAREIMPTLAPALKPSVSTGLGSSTSSREGTAGGVGTPRYQKKARRTASENVLLARHAGRPLLQEPANTNLEPGSGSSGTGGSRTRLSRSRLNDIQWQKVERT